MEILILILTLLFRLIISTEIPPSCESHIYCEGDLLHQVQMSGLYKDSKTFVDKSLLTDPITIIEDFYKLKSGYKDGQLPLEVIKSFVKQNFVNIAVLEAWTPPDWTPNPSISKSINDPKYKKWSLDLNDIWKDLSRKTQDSIAEYPDRHSIIYVPNGFIVPGGRFNELYYWDTLWIVNGVLLCDMFKTAKGIIENLLHLVKLFGFVPNGSRIYFTQRSQPPTLTLMVDSYFKTTNDFQFIKDNIDVLDREMDFWNTGRIVEVYVKGKSYLMYRYYAVSSGPRPESYREDMATVSSLKSDEEKTSKFIELKSGAESGWDFSSRWYRTEGFENLNLTNIRTSTIIPVDLNSLLHKCFATLSNWYYLLGDSIKYKQYKDLADQLLDAIENVFWNEKDGIWYDYDLMTHSQRKYFYMSNFAPLWTKSYNFNPLYISNKITNYLIKYKLIKYVGGTPTSHDFSSQQWDFPNAWPPLQAFLIQGLENIGTQQTSEAAFFLANKWLRSNYQGFKKYHKMFEKYDSLKVGESGAGGEYEAQNGFGWTNGIALEFLNKWGKELISEFS
uniref:Trehalase n=1 Tax=Ectomocoris sp. TaxID=3104572 RepID=A0AB38ZE60_9HEMI